MDALQKMLMKQGYGFAGNHTAVKLCTWLKKSLKNQGFCYKQQFYGIESHRCCQMSPAVGYCQNRCVYCWREMELSLGNHMDEGDEPSKIIDKCIAQQRKLLSGFGGNAEVDKKKFAEAQQPKHFAISLTGEPTLYPYLDKLIKELHNRGMTSYLVTNGLQPEILKEIQPPTQLYISIEAPNKELYSRLASSTLADAWERLQQSLDVMKKTNTRTVLRITAIKGMNMTNPPGYAKLIQKARPDYVEVKAYMFVGSSRQRLTIENMPMHEEVKEFALSIAKVSGYKLKDEKKESRVVLLSRD